MRRARVGAWGASQLRVLWKDPSGLVFPIGEGASLQANGSFTAQAHAPSLLNGSPVSSVGGGQVGVVFSHSNGVQQTVMPITAPGTPVFKVKVVGPDGQPIQNAVVGTAFLDQSITPPTPPPNGQTVIDIGSQDLFAVTTQLSSQVNQTQPGGAPDPFACQPSDLYGRTDANGIFTPKFDWELADILGSQIPLNVPGHPGGYWTYPSTTTVPVEVNAQYQGFGEVKNGVAVLTTVRVVYDRFHNRFYDETHTHLVDVNPLVIHLPKLPANIHTDIPIEPSVGGGVKKNSAWLAFGDFLSLAKAPGVAIQGDGDLRIQFESDPQLTGNLSNVRFFLDGQEKGAFTTGLVHTTQCDAVTYYFDLPHAYQTSAGWHLAQIKADTTLGTVTQFFYLKFTDPPAWFLDPTYKNLEANVYSYPLDTYLVGSQLPAGGANTAASIGANVPRVGQLNNSGGAENRTVQTVYAGSQSGLSYSGGANAQALNTNAPQRPFSASGGALVQGLRSRSTLNTLSAAGSTTLSYGEDNITILDSGWVPLFRDQWGIWPIASATIGADMWFNAHLSYNGTLTIDPGSGATSTYLKVHPQATVSVKAWFDLSVLFGLVDAGADARPSIAVHVPVVFTNASISDSDVCFRYRLDVDWWAKVGYCPLCKKGDGTKNIFAGSIPSPLPPLCQAKAQAAASAASPPPSSAPTLGTDGLGHTLAVWSGASGALLSSTFDGQDWNAPAPVPNSDGGADARVAFYAPNQAVAVWSSVSLSQAQLATATFSDTVKSQHLVYATWNGSQWSSPADLTPANSSDGRATLAGCPSTDPVCPSGGAVTAVWVRDVAGALGERHFRLFYATFHNDAWSGIQPVDAASTATDSMPSVVYVQGKPVVFWIRDADRSLATLNDRRLVYRVLDGASAVQQPVAFPTGAETPSVAATDDQMNVAFVVAHDPQALIGNQRTLYSAETTCPSLTNRTVTVVGLTDRHRLA